MQEPSSALLFLLFNVHTQVNPSIYLLYSHLRSASTYSVLPLRFHLPTLSQHP